MAKAPVPMLRTTAMVAPAALEEVVVGVDAAPDPEAVGVGPALLDEEETAAAVKFVGSILPQSASSVALQAA